MITPIETPLVSPTSSDLFLSKPNATMNVESDVMTNIRDVMCMIDKSAHVLTLFKMHLLPQIRDLLSSSTLIGSFGQYIDDKRKREL